MERTKRSWKESSEVGKIFLKLESFAEVGKFRCSWKVLAEVGKFKWTWKIVTEVGKSDSDVGDDFGMLTTNANVKK